MCHDRLNYVERMHAQGYRVTPQRQMILDAICAGCGHTTFEDILRRAQAQAPTLNRATLYRTLDFLCRLRLVVALEWDGQTYYEIAGESPHHHLVCRVCGQMQALDNRLLDQLIEAVRRQHRFAIDMDHVALLGLCEQCNPAAGSGTGARGRSRKTRRGS
jgi:Fur family ferric uptake transcriptional regulator